MNAFATLPGELWYNRWAVSGIAFAQLRKATIQENKEIFAGGNPPPSSIDTDAMYDANADELALKCDEVIPFPHEHSHALTKEMINVFDVGTVVAFQVGSGVVLKGVLMANGRGIAVCKSRAHKTWVMKNMDDFVAVHRLVTYPDMPKKPQALVRWEETRKTGGVAPQQPPAPKPPPPPALSGPIIPSVPTVSSGIVKPQLPQPGLLAGFGGGKL